MAAAAIASSTESKLLVANHLAMARSLPKEARTITGEGTQATPLLHPQGKRLPAYLSSSNSYPCTLAVHLPPREPLRGKHKKPSTRPAAASG
ncbi:hypothetical protein AVEN_210134-1 [Araneus ventricosus]|uniref:Uncharacterized protein n=1 Tax=Araneus ventricosus TaxID=182803 RepID=A0A4Y2TMA1_ARAVE|nr:hypothetical protein AVEN_210134-1 [Araneus ventricosus]